MNLLELLDGTICGGLAAAGFGVLFNVRLRQLPWCAASGALALAVRTLAQERGLTIVAASFIAALAVGIAVHWLPSSLEVSRDALHVVACIPMIPGGFATKAILGFFAATAQSATATDEMLINAMDSSLRVAFTIGALGTGLAIPALLFREHR